MPHARLWSSVLFGEFDDVHTWTVQELHLDKACAYCSKLAMLTQSKSDALDCLQELSHEQAWEHYSKLLKDLLIVCQLTSIQQWPQLQELLQGFAKQSPGAVARAAMHVAITGA